MSREIRELSTEQVAKLIYARCCEYFGPGHEEMSITIIAQEIERLLADEREKGREMCVEALAKNRKFVHERNIQPYDGFRVSELLIAEATIRQLDLTKDLAASSREEEKE